MGLRPPCATAVPSSTLVKNASTNSAETLNDINTTELWHTCKLLAAEFGEVVLDGGGVKDSQTRLLV
jgi:hypothetical protein